MSRYVPRHAAPRHRQRHPGLMVRIAAFVCFFTIGLGVAIAFWAYTDNSNTYPAEAVADSLPPGATPSTPTTNIPNGNTVTVTFAQVATTTENVPITNYKLNRYPAAGGSAVPVSASCSLSSGTVSCVEISVPDGNWQYTDSPSFGTNWVGAQSAKSGAVTVDTTPPTVAVTIPVDGDSYTNTRWGGPSGAFSGTATDATSGIAGAASISLTITRLSNGTIWNGTSFASGTNTVPASTYNSTTGAWTYAFPAGNFPADGEYTVKATATDAATNVATSATTTFKINNALAIGISFPVNGSFYNSSSWTAGAPIDGTATILSSASISIQKGTGGCWTGTGNAFTASCPNYLLVGLVNLGTWSRTFTTSNFAGDDAYTVKARADLLGNSAVTTSTFVYDTTAPTPTVASPANGSYINATTPTISGTAGTQTADGSHSADSSMVTVRIFAGSGTGGTLLQTLTTSVSSGTWAVVPAALTPNAQYTAQVIQTDGAGNAGSATSTFVIDTVAPVVTLTSPANGSTETTATPTFSGAAGQVAASTTASADSTTVTVKIYAGPNTGGTLVQTLTTTRSAGSWSATASALPAGQYTAQASQSDGAGDVGTSSPNTFTIALGPSLEITFPSNATFFNSAGWNSAHGFCPVNNVCGAASPSFGNVTAVTVQIKDVDTSLCWNGQSGASATFTSACNTNTGVSGGFFTATDTGTNFSTWRIATADAAQLTDGHTYQITARGTDSAGTQSTVSTFGYDNTAPAITNVHVVNADTYGFDEVQPGHNFYVIATVTDNFSGVGTVTANISSLDGILGDTAVPLGSCSSCSIRGTSYNYVSGTFTATSSVGSKNITVTAADNASSPNTFTTGNISILVDGTGPTVSAFAINNKVGGVAGQPEPGDIIIVTYSSTLNVPSICSSWTNPDTTAGAVANNASLAITKGTTDVVTIGSPACRLHFGSIDLGATGYINGSIGQVLTFGGSTISWNGNTTLTITLGSVIGGTATQGTYNQNSIGTYIPDPNVSSIAGNLITGTGTTGSNVLF